MAIPRHIDRFKILQELGKGSQGVVYLASDPRLERHVAIKTLHKRFSESVENQERLMREARTVSKLQHPNIIPLYEAGEYKGQLYLVFEYVDGMSLKDHINKKGPFVVHRAITLMRQILEGIACAHEKGVIHRDLSPSNILIDKNDMPRIMDFGISVLVGGNGNQGKSIAGTPYYMSPEHFKKGALCTQSDIFSLGLVFYEMLVARPAIEGDNDFTIMYKIANEKTNPPSLENQTVDKALDAIVLKAAEKDLNRRYSDVSEMRRDLDGYLDDDKGGEAEKSGDGKTHSTLDFLMRKIRHKTDFPTFSNNIVEINRKASVSRANYVSASELANVVLKDYSLTNKLLKLVNSAFYGQFAGKITTISRAVVVLGFEQVSMAASSLMLFEQLKSKGQKEELREAAVGSFMSGMIAKDLAGRMGVRGTEEVFICSMFHNLGKHLVLFYFEEEYRQIKKLIAQKGIREETAARSVLGMTYEELGIGIGKAWKFPDKIVNSMRNLPKGMIDQPKSEEDFLRNLSGFSNELCVLVSKGEEEDGGKALKSLFKQFEKTLPISRKQISELLDSAKEKVEEYSSLYNVNLKQSNFMRQVDDYSTKNQQEKVVDARGKIETGRDEPGIYQEDYEGFEIPVNDQAAAEMKDPQTILINGIQDITNTLLEDFELNDVLTMILETMYRGFSFTRVIFCALNGKTKEMKASLGFGKDIDRILKKFNFKVSRLPDVFNFSVLQAKDVGIEDATDSRFRKRIPEWYVRSVSASAFVLYPVAVNKDVFGLFYADRESTGMVLSGTQSNYLKTLCNQAVLAKKQKMFGLG
jgi:serine/threonine protein kinase